MDSGFLGSITSVTSFYNREIFLNWRRKSIIEEANRITKKATAERNRYFQKIYKHI